MLPISGPFTKSYRVKGNAIWTGYVPTVLQHTQVGYRQKKPFNLVLPLTVDRYAVTHVSAFGTHQGYVPITTAGVFDSSHAGLAVNKCHGKFSSEVSDSSQLANTMLEMNQTLTAFVDRAVQLRKFTVAVRRGDFSRAASLLDLSRAPRGVGLRKKWSDNWLEYHFGWEPLVKEIHSTSASLCRDFSPKRIRVTARSHDKNVVRNVNSLNGTITRTSILSSVVMAGELRITNPNVSLLSDLGLVNPASVLWEAVPFSFVVDWFANVGQVMSSWSMLAGKAVANSSTTVFQKIDWENASYGVVPGPIDPPLTGPWSTSTGCYSLFVRRSAGITGPSLRVRPFKGFSVVRGATAVALLLSSLRG